MAHRLAGKTARFMGFLVGLVCRNIDSRCLVIWTLVPERALRCRLYHATKTRFIGQGPALRFVPPRRTRSCTSTPGGIGDLNVFKVVLADRPDCENVWDFVSPFSVRSGELQGRLARANGHRSCCETDESISDQIGSTGTNEGGQLPLVPIVVTCSLYAVVVMGKSARARSGEEGLATPPL